MQNGRFIILTGHLSEYALSDLVGILRRQRKTGRLLIEYAMGPASFYFQDGELIDVRLNQLSGLQALCVAVAQPEASFNFNPLVKASHRSIESSLQRVVSEMLGCWDHSSLEIEVVEEKRNTTLPPSPPVPAAARHPRSIPGMEREPLALPPFLTPEFGVRRRFFLLMATASLIIVAISTVIALSRGFMGSRELDPASAASNHLTSGTTENALQPQPIHGKNQSRKETPTLSALKSRSTSSARRSDEPLEKTSGTREERKATESRDTPASNSADNGRQTAKADDIEAVDVVMQIENGRVLQASVANHKPGMDGYESLALRIARQRRYPAKSKGQETVRIRVIKPE